MSSLLRIIMGTRPARKEERRLELGVRRAAQDRVGCGSGMRKQESQITSQE